MFATRPHPRQSLPTYEWLASAGITPSTTQTYTLATLLAALKKASGGFKPALDCTSNSINAISWYYNLKGSAIDGVFVPIDAPQAGTCSSTAALKYPPKGSPTTTSTSATSTGTSAPGSFPTKATIKAVQSGSTAYVGGLLSAGTWSTQTLATYTLNGNASRFTMTSSKGNCGVSGGVFSCGSGVTLTPFAAVGPAVSSCTI
ncbi:hypothetical protein DXG03_008462 [Asterophora parasitica]|uniref:RNase T2-like C-terminal domain-containing protein n=1 Tax=Asterophora parasitica TaxID=117018 RepID=A0A9P7GC14_9AGAR|nr:hypothetical protein DXG03_008462 [Asterophora parasitica]